MLSEKIYEQLIQDYMHLFAMHVNIIIVYCGRSGIRFLNHSSGLVQA